MTAYHRPVTTDRKPPLTFVACHGEPHLDATLPFSGNHFILAAALVDEAAAADVRAAVSTLPRGKSPDSVQSSLAALATQPYRYYAVVVDKRVMRPGSGLAYEGSFYKFLSALLSRKLFDAFPDLHVVADTFARETFMGDFARYLVENHRATLFDRPRVSFASAAEEPLVGLADLVAKALAITYEAEADAEAATLLPMLREHAVLIDEWPVRYRTASGTGSLLAGDPSDDDLARYGIARAEDFLADHEDRIDEGSRAQVVILKKLLYEARFGDPRAYVPSQALRDTLDAVGAPSGEQWLRSNVIAHLRDAGVLVSSSPQGYKIPIAIADVSDFVAVTDTVVHPMLNRVARAREAVLLVTGGRVDVLAGERLELLRAAVDAIRTSGGKRAP